MDGRWREDILSALLSLWYMAAALAASRMATDPARPAYNDCVASASHPDKTGPIAWPTANTTVKTATAGPHAVLGSDVLTRSVTAVGAVNIPPPKRRAERIVIMPRRYGDDAKVSRFPRDSEF